MIKTFGFGEAHGKVILGGEHSVVHGMPAIVLPMPIKVTARAKIINEGVGVNLFSKEYPQNYMKNHPDLDGYVQMISFIKKALKFESEIQVEVFSDIPIQSGLGSSAAVANSIANSVIDLIDGKENPSIKNDAVSLAEKFAHGNPSGLDALGTQYLTPLFFQKDGEKPAISPLIIQGEFYFVVAISGINVSTKQVVDQVNSYFIQNPLNKALFLEKTFKIVSLMVDALANGNEKKLGQLMNENHEALKTLGVSSKNLDAMVNLAISKGALGAKLSGKGIGGAVIALAKNRSDMLRLAKSFHESGATHVYPLVINEQKRNLYE